MEGGTEQQNDSQMHRLLGGFPQCFYLTSSPLYSKAGKADNCELYDMFFVLFCFYDFFYNNQYSNNNNKNVKNPSQSSQCFCCCQLFVDAPEMADTYISGTLELFNYVRRNSASHSISCLQLLLLICLHDAPSLLLARHHLSCGGSPSCCRVCLVLI